ncbi:hypothetical protein LRP67_01665 [Nocardioides sp. cx-169]|uniref:hypothetical protein n=1 Tax=Nocardioides sp. cx-169 TaxID=2899080 RepID=UPI001E65E199|nr:hypothetical protein [Nocardioides sp. cx-169]MCD4532793.1 hypothetical protein [Nocardioides sp. cx-169]
MRRRPPSSAALALSVAKSLVLVAVVVLAFGLVGSPSSTPSQPRPPLSTVDLPDPATRLARALDRHDCAEAGFGAEVQPRSALIRRHGRLHHVSFEEGWAVFTERRPGVLVALCLDEDRPGG